MVLYVKHYYHPSTDSPSCCPAFQNTTTPKASPPLLANGENDARHVVVLQTTIFACLAYNIFVTK